MAGDKRSAVVTAETLRTIYRTAPDEFEELCRKIIAQTTDEVTKQFWQDVKDFAARDREK
jgi:hypothetical protein